MLLDSHIGVFCPWISSFSFFLFVCLIALFLEVVLSCSYPNWTNTSLFAYDRRSGTSLPCHRVVISKLCFGTLKSVRFRQLRRWLGTWWYSNAAYESYSFLYCYLMLFYCCFSFGDEFGEVVMVRASRVNEYEFKTHSCVKRISRQMWCIRLTQRLSQSHSGPRSHPPIGYGCTARTLRNLMW